MIRAALPKAVSLLIAAAVVTGAAHLGMPRQTVGIEGGGTAVEARMGSRFEDMAVGTLTALSAEDATPAAAAPAQAEPASAPQALVPIQAQTAPSDTAVLQAVTAPAITPAVQASRPVEAAQPAPAPQALLAQAPDSDAPTLSKRPSSKNPELAAKVAETQARERAERSASRAAATQAKPAKKTPRGNAQRNNTKGSETGNSPKAKAKTTGKLKQPTSQAGNAAVSNYPGQVMKRISRAGKPRVRASGTAVISFSISARGGLAGISVARSSGSAALDKAAVGLIRKAAPFPRPPTGAQRRFTIRIKGR